jgi:hypothetical protein
MITKIYKRVKFKSGGAPARWAEVEARAGREGKGVRGKGIPAPPERNFSEIGARIFLEKVRILFRIGSQFLNFAFPASLGASPRLLSKIFPLKFSLARPFGRDRFQ